MKPTEVRGMIESVYKINGFEFFTTHEVSQPIVPKEIPWTEYYKGTFEFEHKFAVSGDPLPVGRVERRKKGFFRKDEWVAISKFGEKEFLSKTDAMNSIEQTFGISGEVHPSEERKYTRAVYYLGQHRFCHDFCGQPQPQEVVRSKNPWTDLSQLYAYNVETVDGTAIQALAVAPEWQPHSGSRRWWRWIIVDSDLSFDSFEEAERYIENLWAERITIS